MPEYQRPIKANKKHLPHTKKLAAHGKTPPVPTGDALKKLPLGMLDQLCGEWEKYLFATGNNYHAINDIPDADTRTLFATRNARAFAAVKGSAALKTAAKQLSHMRLNDPSIAKNELKILLPYADAHSFLLTTLAAYHHSLNGYGSAVKLSPAGTAKAVHLSDTVDRDFFYDLVMKKYSRVRNSDAPGISASIFAPGALLETPKGDRFIATKVKNALRWQPANDGAGSARAR